MAVPVYPPATAMNLLLNTRTQPKIVFLPAASTIQAGGLFHITDMCGNAGVSSIFISTVGRDSLDGRNFASTNYALLSTNFQSVLLASDGLINWMILQNYNANVVSRRVGFQPTQVAGLQLWLDSSDAASLSLSGTSVTQWRDKSGNGNTAVAGTATYPVYNSNTLNGRATIGLQGANDYFLVSNNFTMTTFPSLCYFIVIRPASSQPNTGNAGILSTDTAGAYGRSLAFGGGSWQQEYYSGFTNITPYTAGAWAIAYLQFVSTTSATFALNGTTYAATATGTGTNTAGFKIGSYNSDGGYASFNANFDVAEILVYGASLTTLERQQLEGYLAWKWGLQSSLPSNHPYKNAAP